MQALVRFSHLAAQDSFSTAEVIFALRRFRMKPGSVDSPTTWSASMASRSPLSVAVFEVRVPGDDSPPRFVVDATDFNALATDVPMAELLKLAPAAKGVKASKHAGPAGGTSIDYGSPQFAGRPHRGRVTEAEARVVREHLDEVNARLAEEGHRQIDPSDPATAERYGFGASAAAPDAA